MIHLMRTPKKKFDFERDRLPGQGSGYWPSLQNFEKTFGKFAGFHENASGIERKPTLGAQRSFHRRETHFFTFRRRETPCFLRSRPWTQDPGPRPRLEAPGSGHRFPAQVQGQNYIYKPFTPLYPQSTGLFGRAMALCGRGWWG